MAVDNVTTSSTVGADGNKYTTAVSNDTLTNADFLKLMLEEMKQQDPTKPNDSAAIMDSQMKMSTIQSTQDMATAMASLQASYSTSALSTAANIVGHNVQNGTTDDTGNPKIFKVTTVNNKDGEISLHAQERTGIADVLSNKTTELNVLYNTNTGVIYEDGEATKYTLALDSDGRFQYNDDKTIKIVDENNEVITNDTELEKYTHGGYAYTYADAIDLPLNSITSIS